MPRMARIVIPGYPHHVVQRGHNCQVTFAEAGDYERYLATLEQQKADCGISVLAWCLMTNHVHLLLVPARADSLARVMKRLAGRQTRHHNKQERRSGTLWEGRYKSSVVQRDDYLLACCRYIELNPVRANIVSAPEAYPWSSCRQRLGLAPATLLDSEWAIHSAVRRASWRNYLLAAPAAQEWTLIRTAVQRGQLTGSERFTQEVTAIVGRRVASRGPGRPGQKESCGK